MDEKTIIKNEILIAQFEGFEAVDNGGYGNIFYSEDNERTAIDTSYHSSWDWLMPVMEECLCKLNMDDRHYHAIHDALWSIKIENTYKEVVKFIKFYNESKNI